VSLKQRLVGWRESLERERARLTGRWSSTTGPHFILELTPHCNQSCRYCYNAWKRGFALESELLDAAGWCALIEKLQEETGCRRVTFSGGEPLLHPGFREILAFCRRRGMESVLITNGQRLTDETLTFCMEQGVRMFELTLLGSDAATHEGLTRLPGSWEGVLEAMARLYRAGATWCGVFVATRENVAQVRETLEMVVALGARAVMFNRFNPGGEGAGNLDLLPTVEQVREALVVVDELAATYDLLASASIPIMPCLLDTSPYRHVHFGFCSAGRENAYPTLGPDGRVRPCNHSATLLGDFRTQTMAEILASPALRAFTAAVPEICRPCPALEQCRAGCRAAAEVCFGSPEEPEPWLRANWRAPEGA
jgi:radical SAM protein with 4Fe4S-binding SPASM domain